MRLSSSSSSSLAFRETWKKSIELVQAITGSRKSIILFFFLSVFIARGKQRVELAITGVIYHC